MLAGKRSIRVGEQIQKVIALLLIEKVKDPRIRDVTITGVKISNDLKVARVYFSVFSETEHFKDAKKGLESAKGFIKREIGLRLNMKYIPEITFLHDTSLENGDRMDRLLKELGSDGSRENFD